jgi:hypothetical protein
MTTIGKNDEVEQLASPVTPMERFGHTRTQGARLSGWPEINTILLAGEMDVHPSHLRDVLTGRVGTTTRYLERIATATGLNVAEIVRRTQQAQVEEDRRIAAAKDRWELRQQKRAMRKILQ